MPTLESSDWIDFSIELNTEEFLKKCSDREILEIVDYLVEEGYISKLNVISKNQSIMEEQWNNDISKLRSIYLTISENDENIIKSIINKY